jgi:acetyl-CoA carboxylase, biotin carboxylase subunit
VYAEDPANNFLPDIGTLQTYKRPQGHGIRVDDGFEQGMNIPFHYDPMIAKLICHADTREGAIEKMIRAIHEYEITGLETTLGFCLFVMKHEAFRTGKFDTKFVENFFRPALLPEHASAEEAMLAAALATTLLNGKKNVTEVKSTQQSRWKKNRV